jgi:mRNA interferase RelE/StbE
MQYRYEFTKSAFRQLARLPKTSQRQIIKKLDYFASARDPLGFANRLINSDIGTYRFRIGNYRVVFDMENETMVILAVGNRKDIYR